MTTTGEPTRRAIAAILGSNKRENRNLILLLQEMQTAFGYLPRVALERIASFLRVPPVDVWGVATFYNQFRFLPLGKYPIKVCMGTACHLARGRAILESLERELDIKVGGITADSNFSLDRVACIGCCMLAPVMVVGDKIHSRMTPFKAEEALIPHKQEIQRELSDSEEAP